MDLLKKKLEVAAPLELPKEIPPVSGVTLPKEIPPVPGVTVAAVSGVGK